MKRLMEVTPGRTGFLNTDAKSIECPRCKAAPGVGCRTPKGRETAVHAVRVGKYINDSKEDGTIGMYQIDIGISQFDTLIRKLKDDAITKGVTK